MVIFSGETLTGCHGDSSAGFYYWTAGQRIDPTRESTFVWRVTSTITCSDAVTTMTYTNWGSGRPNYYGPQSCMTLMTERSYSWDDTECSVAACSVCELDM